MKKTLLSLLLVAGYLIITLPAAKAENELTLPVDAIGISEATYSELQTLECTGYEDPNLGTQYSCPDLVADLLDKVIFRAEHLGEMYKVSYLSDPSGHYATVVLKTYLPDGFYKANNKYYWISNNIKLRLKRGSAYSTLLSGIKCDDTYCMAYTGISKTNFETMLMSCEGYAENPDTDQLYQECITKYIQGEDLRWQLRGKVIMLTEANGELYYISNNDFNNLYELGKKADNKSFYKFIKTQAITVNKNQMRKIDRYHNLG